MSDRIDKERKALTEQFDEVGDKLHDTLYNENGIMILKDRIDHSEVSIHLNFKETDIGFTLPTERFYQLGDAMKAAIKALDKEDLAT